MPVHLAERTQQLRKQRASSGDVATVGVDVLAEHRDLGDAGLGEHGRFAHEILQGAADLPSADARHDAVSAGVVASRLNGHPRGEGQLAHRVERGGHVAAGRRIGRIKDLDQRAFARRSTEQRRRRGEVVGAKDHVDPRRALQDGAPILLGHAAADGDLKSGPFLLQCLQLTEGAVELEVGVLADGAGVKDDDVGVRVVRRGNESVGHQEPGQTFGVVLVHLAAKGPNGERTRF